MDFLNYNSVETLPGYEARAAFTVNSSSVLREDVDIVPTVGDDRRQGRKHVYFRLDLQHYLRLHRQQRY